MKWFRLGYKLLLLTCIIWLCGYTLVRAQTYGLAVYNIESAKSKEKRTAGAMQGEVTTDGECTFDEKAKKKIADQAYKSIYEAYEALIKFNESIKKNVIAENGSCHYLYNKLLGPDSIASDDANRYALKFTETAHAGASIVDQLNHRKTTATQLLEIFGKNLTYAGLDVRKITRRNQMGDAESSKMVMWSQTAKKGDRFEIDEATSELLEETFGYKVDCQYAEMTDDNGSFSCYQNLAIIEKTKEKVKNWVKENPKAALVATVLYGSEAIVASTVAGVDELAKETGVSVAFSCTKDNCSNGNGPFGEQVDGLIQQSKKCMSDLEVAAQQRDELIAKRKEAHNLLDVLSGNLEVHCTCEDREVEKDGKKEQTSAIKECVAINPDFIKDNMDYCLTIAEYQTKLAGAKGENCVTCKLFHTILRAVHSISQKAYDAIAPSLKGLLSIAFGIYIAYITLLAVATPAAQKLGQYLTNLTTQGAKVAIALILLSAPEFVYGTIVSPFIEGGVDFGMSLTRENEAKVIEYGSSFEFDASNTYLNKNVLQNTVGAAVAFNEAASMVPAIGRSLICNAWQDVSWIQEALGAKSTIFMRLQMWIEGIILYLFGLAIAFAVGFYMLDCAIQLGIVCAMMPFFVACWPFKITRSYSKAGWDIFLNTVLNFVVMGIIITLIAELMSQALGTGLTEESLATILNSGNAKLIMDEIDFGGLQMVMLIICCLIALKIGGEIQNITNKLAGGLSISIGAGLGGSVASYATKTATALAASAGVAGYATAQKIGHTAASAMKENSENSDDSKESEDKNSGDEASSESKDSEDGEK